MTDIVNNSGIYFAIAEVVDVTGTMITGRTDIELAITRLSDDFVLDWSDLTFKATGSVTTRRINVPELDAVTNPGIYELAVDLSTITNEVQNDHYIASMEAPAIFYEAHNDFSTEDADATSGFGDFTITITVEDSSTNPIPSVDVMIKDSTDAIVIARKTTDVAGQAIFNLDAATYLVHLTRTMYDFPGSPETLVVTADAPVTYNGDLIVIPPAVGGAVCAVSGTEFDENNSPISGMIVQATIEGDTNFVTLDPSTHVVPISHQDITDVNGQWTLELIRSVKLTTDRGKDSKTYQFAFIKPDGKSPHIIFRNITVPDQASANFKDLI